MFAPFPGGSGSEFSYMGGENFFGEKIWLKAKVLETFDPYQGTNMILDQFSSKNLKNAIKIYFGK